MAITVTDAGTAITGDSIDLYRFLATVRGLALEVSTGMRVSSKSNLIKVASSYTGEAYRTRKQALRGMVEAAKRAIPDYEVSVSVQRALDK